MGGGKEGDVLTETLHNQNRSISEKLFHGCGVCFSMANVGNHAGGSVRTHKDENKCTALWAFLPFDPTANTAETVALDLL